MRDEVAIVERVDAPIAAIELAVREAAARLRESAHQEAKVEKIFEKVSRRATRTREQAEQDRLELGRALLVVHADWRVRQGERSGRWAAFLARESIDPATARRCMDLARPTSGTSEVDGSGSDETRPPTNDEAYYAQPPEGRMATYVSPEPAIDAVAPSQATLPHGFDLRFGAYQDVLALVERVDVLISDPPYSERTHASNATRDDGVDAAGLGPGYDFWTEEHIEAYVAFWTARNRGWFVNLTDDILAPTWRAVYRRHDLVDFQPVPCVITGMTVRTRGDGPSSWGVYAMVARPRSKSDWGTTPGAHVGKAVAGASGGRGKPLWLMDELVAAYSREGDLICDPLAGFGSTLISAARTRRRVIGAELDAKAYLEAATRARAELAQPTLHAADAPHNHEGNTDR